MEASVEEREVGLDEGLGDQNLAAEAGVDQAPPVDVSASQEDVVDVLKPKTGQRIQKIGKDRAERAFIQRRMSFISKMEWFSLVGDVLDKAMGGDNPLTINNLLSTPGRGGELTLADLRDADMFVHAVGKLLKYAPTFLEDSFCIWLEVPDHEREIVKMLMKTDPDQGGLSDDDGMEIIETFIDQNYGALDTFFRERLAQLRNRVAARAKEASESRQSRR